MILEIFYYLIRSLPRLFSSRIMKTGILCLIIVLLILPVSGRPAIASGANAPAFWGVALHGDPITAAMLDTVEQETGLRPQMIVFFRQWPSPENMGKPDFPLDSFNNIWRRGAVPCLTWEPMYYEGGREIMIPHRDILSGRYDAYIQAFARQAMAWGKPLLIRWGHEMNLSRYHWGTELKGYGPGSPEIYKRMYRHILSIFRKEKAKNVFWVFCPNSESVPNRSYNATAEWNQIRNYYPGNDWVDVIGLDGYNWGESRTLEKDGWQSRPQSFEQIFEMAYRELSALSGQKPLIVFETASVGQGEDRAAWIREAFAIAGRWHIRGIIWFQVRKDCDWRIDAEKDGDAVAFIRRATSAAQHWIENLRIKAP